jgi:hypothetical protein
MNNCNDSVTGLQAQINAAQLGDIVVIPAGATCIGNYILKNKTTGSGWIIIRSSAASQLPEHQRVTPASTSKMAKLVAPKLTTNASLSVLKTESYAHHYRLIGLEMTSDKLATYQTNAIVDLGAEESTTAAIPTDITIDRCYIHGHPALDGRRGIKINSRRTAIIDSYISEIHQVGFDTQAVGGWNGPGPFKIVNNYLEAAGENLMFGGALPTVQGLIATDIEIRKNHLYKPFSWKVYSGTMLPGGSCVYDSNVSSKGEFFELRDSQGSTIQWYQCSNGTWVVTSTVPKKWTVKNLFELKSARRVLVEGNIFENNWANAQKGFSLLLQGMPSDSGIWAVVEDVTFRKNIVKRTAGAINLCGGCFYAPVQTTDSGAANYVDPKIPRVNRVSFVHNIFEDISRYFGENFNFNGILLQILSNTQNVAFTHNTAFPAYAMLNIEGSQSQQVSFVDNIINHGPRVILYEGAGGTVGLDAGIKGWTMFNNVMVAPPSTVNKVFPYPSGNFFPVSYDAVGFVNHNNGLDGDYRLVPSSPYSGKGTDRYNIGAKVIWVTEATQGVANGVAEQ